VEDSLKAYNAVIDTDKCINCNACSRVCQKQNHVSALRPLLWKQGWSNDENVRTSGSSGGACGAISKAFISMGGVVCSCVFSDGIFGFEFAETEDELKKFAGSKYVKSNPQGIYKKIKKLLHDGRKVLFIALPCQVAALKNFVGAKLQAELYTADLICHGTPSPKILEMFLRQYGKSLGEIQDIRFRIKGKFQVYEGYEGVVTTGVTDKYLIAFLNSLTYTDNCYNCSYAKIERVSDITLGDSWGTSLSTDDVRRGVSLMLAQTQKGVELLKNAGLRLDDVDLENAIRNNHQLSEPSHAPNTRDSFFEDINKGKKFNRLVFTRLPKACLRQDVKCVLIKTGLRKSGGGIKLRNID